MPDETLTADRLRNEADGEWIKDFDDQCVKGASYDFRAGETVVVARPDENRYITESLSDAGEIPIKPGYAAAFESYEMLDLPENVKGRLSLRSTLANKKLFYSGGLVDPGYWGNLYFTLFNLGNHEVTVAYGERIVSGEFVEIAPTERRRDREEGPVTTPPDPMKPVLGAEIRMRDWEEMNQLLTDHEAELDRLKDEQIQELKDQIGRTDEQVTQLRGLMENLLLAAIASAFAGIFAGITLRLLSVFF